MQGRPGNFIGSGQDARPSAEGTGGRWVRGFGAKTHVFLPDAGWPAGHQRSVLRDSARTLGSIVSSVHLQLPDKRTVASPSTHVHRIPLNSVY